MLKILIAVAASTVILFTLLLMYGAITGFASQTPGRFYFSTDMKLPVALGILAVEFVMVTILRASIPKVFRLLSGFMLVPFGAAILSFLAVLAFFMITSKFGISVGL